jgi:hypothetical protein
VESRVEVVLVAVFILKLIECKSLPFPFNLIIAFVNSVLGYVCSMIVYYLGLISEYVV